MPIPAFDLVAIGGGPGGLSAALAAGTFGKKAAVIECSSELGGAGINTGTIPSKTLRESALVIAGWHTRKLLGLDISVHHKAKLSEFMHHAGEVMRAEHARIADRMKETGVTWIQGDGSFIDRNTVCVTSPDGNTQMINGDFIVISPGSSPVYPPEFPFNHPRVHDSNEILQITELPRKLAVVGAGVIGSEYASTFAALGVEVHLIDGRETLLPFLDADISAALTRGMTGHGIKFHLDERVTKCEPLDDGEIFITMASGKKLVVTDILVASGRSSNTEKLNLGAIGIQAGKRGLLTVDKHYRTELENIYAVGDVIGPPALAATSMEQARVAVCHAFSLFEKDLSPLLPTGIYTIPEVSMVGETEQSLSDASVHYVVGRAAYSQNPRGHIIGDESGFLKLLFQKGDMKLLGVHMVGEQATELVHIGLVAMQCGASAHLFSTTCFNYPTLGDLYKYAAYDALLKVRPEVPRFAPASEQHSSV